MAFLLERSIAGVATWLPTSQRISTPEFVDALPVFALTTAPSGHGVANGCVPVAFTITPWG